MEKFERIFLIVLDSVGIGEAPDAEEYGDKGSHTLGHIAEHMQGLKIPEMAKLGLSRIEPLRGVEAASEPEGNWAKLQEISIGKDTTTGHWELMGIRVTLPFKTYPDGFAPELIQAFKNRTGRGVLGNKVASGTEILDELGEQHMKTGDLIVYTSADSVFQIAAHEEIVPLDELYRYCEIARELTLDPDHAVGRVIARPFIGKPREFERTPNRRDYSVKPPSPTVLNHLMDAGIATISVGKISDIFAEEGISESIKTKSNMDGVDQIISIMAKDFRGLCFTNLVDFDAKFGHRRDPEGYAKALEEFDQRLPELKAAMRPGDLLLLTADHGNDPTFKGTDHTREYTPLLAYSPSLEGSHSLGLRSSFADVGATVAENFGVKGTGLGTSFLHELR
jgi:phosphopentomutase